MGQRTTNEGEATWEIDRGDVRLSTKRSKAELFVRIGGQVSNITIYHGRLCCRWVSHQ